MGTMGIKIVIFTLGSLGSFGVNPRTQPKGNRNMVEYVVVCGGNQRQCFTMLQRVPGC